MSVDDEQAFTGTCPSCHQRYYGKERDDFCEAIFASHRMLTYLLELSKRLPEYEQGRIHEIVKSYKAARDRLPLELKPRRKAT